MRLDDSTNGVVSPSEDEDRARDEREVGAIQVRVSRGLCQGWGQCLRWAPTVIPLDKEGYIDVERVEVPSELAEQAAWGAGACSEGAITVIGPPLQYWIERRGATSQNEGPAVRTDVVESEAEREAEPVGPQ